jgi:hypothetical protein
MTAMSMLPLPQTRRTMSRDNGLTQQSKTTGTNGLEMVLMAICMDDQLQEEATNTGKRETQRRPQRHTKIMTTAEAAVDDDKQRWRQRGWTRTAAAEMD